MEKVNQFRKDGDLVICDDHQEIKVHLDIEHTRSHEEQYKGLKFRKELPALSGMTFLNEYEEYFVMGMEDTYVPLDMIFISSKGIVADIISDIPALYPGPIMPKYPGCHVLEVNAGLCKEKKIQVGDNFHLHIPGFVEDPAWDELLNMLSSKTLKP